MREATNAASDRRQKTLLNVDSTSNKATKHLRTDHMAWKTLLQSLLAGETRLASIITVPGAHGPAIRGMMVLLVQWTL